MNEEKLALARKVGAHHAILSDADAVATIKELTDGLGANAVFDFVGIQPTVTIAGAAVATEGDVTIVGIGGGALPVGFGGIAYRNIGTLKRVRLLRVNLAIDRRHTDRLTFVSRNPKPSIVCRLAAVITASVSTARLAPPASAWRMEIWVIGRCPRHDFGSGTRRIPETADRPILGGRAPTFRRRRRQARLQPPLRARPAAARPAPLRAPPETCRRHASHRSSSSFRGSVLSCFFAMCTRQETVLSAQPRILAASACDKLLAEDQQHRLAQSRLEALQRRGLLQPAATLVWVSACRRPRPRDSAVYSPPAPATISVGAGIPTAVDRDADQPGGERLRLLKRESFVASVMQTSCAMSSASAAEPR